MSDQNQKSSPNAPPDSANHAAERGAEQTQEQQPPRSAGAPDRADQTNPASQNKPSARKSSSSEVRR